MMPRVYLLSLLSLFFSFAAHAQTPVSASLSSDRVVAGETFIITLSAQGAEVREPDLSALRQAGIQLGTPSVQSSTSISAVGGRTTVVQSRSWRYPATTSQVGTVTIPRIPVMVDGKEYLTPAMTLQVTNSLNLGSPPASTSGDLTVEDLAFVRAVSDKTQVYQGETLTLRLRVFILDQYYVSLEGPRQLPMPASEGFYAGPQGQQTLREQVNGRPYQVTEIVQLLYPAVSGNLEIGAWEWQGSVRWHDPRRRSQSSARFFTAPPIPIVVRPLPERPANFSGAVGRFRVEAQLSQNTSMQGSPVRYGFTVTGEGNPDAIGAPVIPALTWAHVSSPEIQVTPPGSGTETIKAFSYLITPLESGEFVFPTIEFVYFAPALGNFKTETTSSLPFTVHSVAGSDKLVAVGGRADEVRRSIEILDDGMSPIITEQRDFRKRPVTDGRTISFWDYAIFAGLCMAYCAVFGMLHKRRKLRGDRRYARRYFAYKRFLATLESRPADASATDTIYRAVTGYVGDMFDLNESGLTSAEAIAKLQEAGVNDDLKQTLERTLRACERARYAGHSPGVDEIAALGAAARMAVERMEQQLRESHVK